MGSADPLLRVAHISKHYGRLHALDDVSFTIRAGEVLGVIGPNGSGKTTLFACLGGALAADAGGLERAGRSVTADERRALLFYLPDGIAPWPHQTVRWTLDFAAGFYGGERAQRDEIAERLALTPLLDSRIGALSKGQRKRALLAIGLIVPRPILLADEPFDGLDLRQTLEVARVLRDFAAGGRTLVLSIHQIPDARRVCDRFVLLSGGRVAGEGAFEGRDLEEVFLALA